MATILLIFIYIFYIGLGIPDSLLGSAWPAIYGEFHVPVSYASIISAIISTGTVLSSLSVQESLPNWEQQRSPLFQRVLPQSLY